MFCHGFCTHSYTGLILIAAIKISNWSVICHRFKKSNTWRKFVPSLNMAHQAGINVWFLWHQTTTTMSLDRMPVHHKFTPQLSPVSMCTSRWREVIMTPVLWLTQSGFKPTFCKLHNLVLEVDITLKVLLTLDCISLSSDHPEWLHDENVESSSSLWPSRCETSF